MIRPLKYVIILTIIFTGSTCKKKTTIDVLVFNYALNEAVPNAKVVLVERKSPGLFSGNYSCDEIANATTDANGKCVFDKEKLKTKGSYNYFFGIKEAYGLEGAYPCGGKTSGFVEVGKQQTQILNADVFDGKFRVQYNNLLNPSQPNDSIIVGLTTIEYPNPKGGVVQGNGGVFGNWNNYDPNNPPNYPSILLSDIIETKGQRLKRYVRKRKLGIVTVTIDTVKVYPGTTTIIQFDW